MQDDKIDVEQDQILERISQYISDAGSILERVANLRGILLGVGSGPKDGEDDKEIEEREEEVLGY